ncbi:MAG: AAA family ATPase [Eubacterium sp.]
MAIEIIKMNIIYEKQKSERKNYCMKVSMKDVAVIKAADIQLDGITVVAGLNGTGKTTIGKGIYAIINAYSTLHPKIIMSRKNSIRNQFVRFYIPQNDIEEGFKSSQKFMEDLSNQKLSSWSTEEREVVKAEITEWFNRNLKLDDNPEELIENIVNIIKRPVEQDVKFIVDSCYQNVFDNQINRFNSKLDAIFTAEIEDKKYSARFKNDGLVYYEYEGSDVSNAIYIESQNILDKYDQYINRRGSRRNMSDFSTKLFNALRVDKKEVQEDMTVEEYESRKKAMEIVNSIISGVTHGSLEGDTSSEFVFHDEKTSHNVQIKNLSAGIKIFAVLQRLLENGSLKSGDILLIDEPEVNLHPEWQIIFAEILVRIHKELGIIIYLNSHSPYFIRAIEVKLAKNDIGDKGKFYLTQEVEDGLYAVKDVTYSTDEIYELLYKPLENL